MTGYKTEVGIGARDLREIMYTVGSKPMSGRDYLGRMQGNLKITKGLNSEETKIKGETEGDAHEEKDRRKGRRVSEKN